MSFVNVRLTDTMAATINARGLSWVADEPVSAGGSDTGPMPTEMLLGALGACAAITAKMYAQRKGWALDSIEINLSLERFKKDVYPAYTGESDVVNEMRQVMTFHGDLTDEQKTRLMEIAGRCPVHRILTQPNFLFETLNEESAEEI
jgi:putative redox protein